MKQKMVKVFAPASIANLCVGFDVLGVALQKTGDIVVAKRNATHEFRFSVKTAFENVPTSPTDNIAAHVASNMIKELKLPFGIDLELHKLMPVGSGMGSSGASSVAAAFAVNALLKKPLTKMDLLPFVIEGERKASGAAHADNVAPSLLGGACIIRNQSPYDVIPFSVHRSLMWIVIRPTIMIETAKARQLLPPSLPLDKVVQQLGNISGFVLGLLSGDATLIGKCMIDHIAEPVRSTLIPGFSEIKTAALKAGAIGCGISGSGPALFAIARSPKTAEHVAKKMIKTLFNVTGLKADCFISRTNQVGAKIIKVSQV